MRKIKDTLVEEMVKKSKLSTEDCFRLAKTASILIRSNDSKEQECGRKIVVYALDNWHKLANDSKNIWTDLVEACGYYPYLKKIETKIELKNTGAEIRKEIHKSNHLHGKYFHEEQKHLLRIFENKKNLIVSAPTSFGKSLLIEEMVAKKEFYNIIIIQPTLALLEETRRNLKKYKDDYKIIVKTSQKYNPESKNIFLLTAERVIEYPEFPQIDLLIIDEFYKLSSSRKDERADILNIAFYKILKKFNPRFYLLGPNIDGISRNFAEDFNAIFFKTNYSMVTAEIVDIYSKYKSKLDHPLKFSKFRENLLFKELAKLSNEQTIIYCSSPDHTRKLSRNFIKYLRKNLPEKIQQVEIPLMSWIRENIHQNWSLVDCLSCGVAVHDAALPRHISSSIIHHFNRSEIRYLFCTSTIIEGVNTSAKNVVIFDKNKGGKLLDYFDYANISGRAGRLMVHYIGRIYKFFPEPKKESIIIDFPFYDQHTNTSEEIFIQIEPSDVKNITNDNYKAVESIPDEEKELFRKNGVSVQGQKKILEKIFLDLDSNPSLITWTRFPNREQILYIINSCWINLKKPHESQGFTVNKIATLLGMYASQHEIMELVKNEYLWLRKKFPSVDRVQLLDESVKRLFQFQRHWLEYTLPKWFHVINSLQKFACEKKGVEPGDYTYYATSLENDFLKPNLSFFLEMGIPRSAVAKIEKYLNDSLEKEDEIMRFLKENFNIFGFTEYEAQRLRELE